MSKIKNYFHDEICERAEYAECWNDDEYFERLDYAGVGEITWSESLNAKYATWQYLNLK